VGLNSLQYFWKARTPDGASQDLERILRHYLALWKKDRVILIGYSLGADVLPFMVARIPGDLRERVHLIALLGPGREADFEFHLTDWIGGTSRKTFRLVLPEAEKLRGTKMLCFYGEQEKHSLCRDLPQGLAVVIPLKGAHHFGGHFEAVSETILREAK
jgi:type IV secretory pathway VirJ component